jgi:hypothetical protein
MNSNLPEELQPLVQEGINSLREYTDRANGRFGDKTILDHYDKRLSQEQRTLDAQKISEFKKSFEAKYEILLEGFQNELKEIHPAIFEKKDIFKQLFESKLVWVKIGLANKLHDLDKEHYVYLNELCG